MNKKFIGRYDPINRIWNYGMWEGTRFRIYVTLTLKDVM